MCVCERRIASWHIILGYMFFQYTRAKIDSCIDGKLSLFVINNSESSLFGYNAM